MLSDSAERVPAGRIEAWLTIGSGVRELVLAWDYAGMASNENRRGPTVRVKLPSSETGRMRLELIVINRPEWNSEYILSYKGHSGQTEPVSNVLNFGS